VTAGVGLRRLALAYASQSLADVRADSEGEAKGSPQGGRQAVWVGWQSRFMLSEI